ncbi:hypothetical protein K505DRAFT_276815 [Melanomma pulvis-pyrius CBS 109.77]|uniref:BZIP domain-containing protein n=1 Tax=Melanomma pulvis-pyrius CBS 109.77 TaxID=1314802 RepID=A0A6A6XAH1_9PLEO|nr:hypothetical protein K505DRAFT_276815 [Melanomma pulvis-pyrius CBS 109.77]
MTGSEGEGQPPRKRSRTSANSDEAGNKKSRGRPRVDTLDQTPADRRRTQIRVAQRAYRERKELTIKSLKEEKARLLFIVEQMNTCFLRFNESAFKSGLLQLNPVLGRELKRATESFVTLVKSASDQSMEVVDDADEDVLDPAAELHDAAQSARAEHRQPLPVPQHTSIGWGYTATLEESPRNTASSRNEPLQHSTFFHAPYDASNQLGLVRSKSRSMFLSSTTVGQIMDQSRSPTENTSRHQPLPFGLVDYSLGEQQRFSPPLDNNPQIFSVNIPSPRVSNLPSPPLLPNLSIKSLNPPWTYSYDETTFARRLTRASLETGFHLLSGANLRPAARNHVFKLSLPYMPIEKIRERFKLLLSRGTDEELDCWDAPFIHLGGAGTHYPRKDARGNVIPIPNSWTVRSIGPPCTKLVRLESITDSSKDHNLNIDLTGFEGEWFDAYDVQGYLEEVKGCHIDPKDSFTEVYVEVDEELEQEPESSGSLSFSKKVNLDFSGIPSASTYPSNSPSLSYGSGSEPSTSSRGTPTNSTGGMEPMLGQSDSPFGLDMGAGGFDFAKFNVNGIDHSSLYDQPLGLDLAPGFDANLNTTMAGFSPTTFDNMSNLGLDLMGGGAAQLPVVKPKQRKAVWFDVTKFIDEIITHGVCLGRAPGFRRKDVDVAFKAALIDRF